MSSRADASPARPALAVVVWIAALAGAIVLSSAVAQHVRDQQRAAARAAATGNGGSTPAAPARRFDPASVKPADPRSLFRTSNFARALGIVRRRVGARADVQQVRLAPGELQLTVLQGDRANQLSVDADGDYTVLTTSSVSGTIEAFYLSQVHSGVPAALARRIASQADLPVGRLDYMVVATDPVAHRHHWLVYPTGGRVHFQADTASGPILEYGPHGVHTLGG
ncbi:MAG: hypothetical protein E6G56_04645 [Actinobacteria bacterium]|nr:MAG: hypothetical protein E6G56_04645 [Actinomycetota bacterium]